MQITKKIADYIVSRKLNDFSPDAIKIGKNLIIDTIACTLAASKEQEVNILCRTFIPLSNGSSSIIGRKEKSSTPVTAMINGYLSHLLDFDSTNIKYKCHISAVLVPALLAVAEAKKLNGSDVLLSFLVGYEVFCALGNLMNDNYFDSAGWHPTSPLGVIAATAAVSKLLSLDEKETIFSLSIASSLASGLRENFGTMTKPFHIGTAAKNGIISTLLAKNGFTAAKNAIGGKFGFIHAFSWGNTNRQKILTLDIKKPHILQSKTMIKKYPCCASAHLAIDATLDILKDQNVSPSAIKKIIVIVDFDPPRSLIYDSPKNSTEAKFSMQYCIAAVIVDKKIDMKSFIDEKVKRPVIQVLMPKIKMMRKEKYKSKPSWKENFNEVQIFLNNGRIFKKRLKRDNFLDLSETSIIEEKFYDCCNFVCFENTSEILKQLMDIDKVKNIEFLMENLRNDQGKN